MSFLKAYSTKRNSKENLQKWRKDASWTRVQRVQSICKDYMIAFGYKNFNNLQELRNQKLDYYRWAKNMSTKLHKQKKFSNFKIQAV